MTSPIGQAVSRVDGRLKVTGAAVYAADNHPDNLAYGYLLTSTVAKGTITGMDTKRQPDMITTYIKCFSVQDVTDPYLNLFRRFLPPLRVGPGALDLSPMIGIFVLIIVGNLVIGLVDG